MEAVRPEPRQLPLPTLDTEDPGAQAVSSAIGLPDVGRRAAALRLAAKQVPKSREARLRLAGTLAEAGEFPEAEDLLKVLGTEDPWDWRVLWFQARICLARHEAGEARRLFDQVYFDLPGELAPKLALGLAAEMAGERELAARMYDLVSRVDPAFVSAVFGLARCRRALGDARGAVEALNRIPASSALSTRARVEAARTLLGSNGKRAGMEDLQAASAVAEGLALDGRDRWLLDSQIFEATILELSAKKTARVDGNAMILGLPLAERPLREGLERSLRSLARVASDEERLRLVDEANRVRPRTLV